MSNTTIPPTSIPLSENSPAFHVQVQSQQANVDLSHSNSHADLHDTVSANNIKAHCLVRSNAAADTEKMSACGVTVPNQIQATQLHGRLQCDASELCPSKPSHRFPPELQKSARPPARSMTANAILHGSRNFQHPGVYRGRYDIEHKSISPENNSPIACWELASRSSKERIPFLGSQDNDLHVIANLHFTLNISAVREPPAT